MVSLPQLSKELPCSTTNVGAAKIFAKVMHKLSDDMYCWLIFSTTIYYGAYDSKVLYHLDSFLRVVIFLHGLLFFKIRISTLFLLFCPIHKCFLVDTRSGFSVLWKGAWMCEMCVFMTIWKMCENRSCSLPWSRQRAVHVPDTFIYFPAQEEKHPPQQPQHCTVTRLLPRHKALLKACRL